MLSVCIPVYNVFIYSLVNELASQIANGNLDVEILVFDDHSIVEFKSENRKVSELKCVNYLELEQNIGRAAIRNKLVREAKGSAILFIDCDMRVVDNLFLKKYYELHEKKIVVVGGVSYTNKCPNPMHLLRWKYGVNRESTPAFKRQCKPYSSFMTGNVMIPKLLLIESPFHSQIIGYGHEDTVFGFELMKMKYPIFHIDNPLQHDGLENSSEFLAKTKVGIDNLVLIWNRLGRSKDFTKMVKLLKAAVLLNNIKIGFIFSKFFLMFNGIIEKNLYGRHPNLRLFDFYKLGLILQAIKKEKIE
jgi:glycosyltransferase involved in cell wall biosynthesis